MQKAPISFHRMALLAATVAVTVGLPSTAFAGGFYLQEQSVKAAGRAFSGEAADQGPESLWWNPAAIAGIASPSAYLGVSAVLPSGTVRDTGTLIVRPGQAPAGVGGDPIAHNPISNGMIPSGAIAMPINDRVAVGVAITSPYSFTTNYAANSWVRYTADKTKLRTIDIQPSIGFAATDWLRIGAGVNLEYSDATLGNALPNLSPLLPDGAQSLKGDGWDFGWSAGAQIHNDVATLGFSYKSSITHTLSGTVVTSGLLGPLAGSNGTIGTKARFRTPWQAIISARYKVMSQLTLNAQVVRIGWNRFDAIRLGPPLNVALPEEYRNTWSFAGGVDYDVTPKWTMRAGIQHDQTPTRDRARDARVPDADRWNFALGTSYRISPSFTIDAAANYIAFKDAAIDRTTAAFAGTPAQTPILVSGELDKAHAVVLALGGRFAF